MLNQFYTFPLVFSADDDDSCDGEPSEKRMKLEQDININMEQSIKVGSVTMTSDKCVYVWVGCPCTMFVV